MDAYPSLAGMARSLIRRLVVARRAAGLTIHQAVNAQADVNLRLAEDAVFLAFAARLGLFTLCANNTAGGWLGGHGLSVGRSPFPENITEVMGRRK